ncbi:MAG: alpha-amylase, partial [Lachnospiraceae bacterium]|nr:alpha-amylase [Lachnospiraceae bacterium]
MEIFFQGISGSSHFFHVLKIHDISRIKPYSIHIEFFYPGFNAIYIGPLFESVGHGYETTDYKRLDRRLGDNKDLKNFVKKCH